MLVSVFSLVVFLAFATTIATLTSSLTFAISDDAQSYIDIIGGFSSSSLWGVAALGATAIEVGRDSTIYSEPMVSYLFGVFAIFMAIIGIIGTTFMVDVRDIEATR